MNPSAPGAGARHILGDDVLLHSIIVADNSDHWIPVIRFPMFQGILQNMVGISAEIKSCPGVGIAAEGIILNGAGVPLDLHIAKTITEDVMIGPVDIEFKNTGAVPDGLPLSAEGQVIAAGTVTEYGSV